MLFADDCVLHFNSYLFIKHIYLFCLYIHHFRWGFAVHTIDGHSLLITYLTYNTTTLTTTGLPSWVRSDYCGENLQVACAGHWALEFHFRGISPQPGNFSVSGGCFCMCCNPFIACYTLLGICSFWIPVMTSTHFHITYFFFLRKLEKPGVF